MPDGTITPLHIRKHADRSEGERVARFHPVTGERMLVKPETVASEDFDYEKMEAEPWPLAGITLEHDEPPARTRVPTRWIMGLKSLGLVALENEEVVHRSGGPPENPWGFTHTFVHADAIIFKTLDGDIRYRVTEQPDKWPEDKDGTAGFGGEVNYYYDLELDQVGAPTREMESVGG